MFIRIVTVSWGFIGRFSLRRNPAPACEGSFSVITSLARFYNFSLNLYDVSLTEKSVLDIIFLKKIVLKVTEILDPKHHNPITSTK